MSQTVQQLLKRTIYTLAIFRKHKKKKNLVQGYQHLYPNLLLNKLLFISHLLGWTVTSYRCLNVKSKTEKSDERLYLNENLCLYMCAVDAKVFSW